jgi:hypothetical protein
MIKKNAIRGRQVLALIVTLDSVVLAAALLLLLTAIDLGNGYDIFFLAAHMIHLFSVMLGYVVVRHSSTVVDSLRLVMLIFCVLLIVDLALVVARIVMLSHEHGALGPLRHMHLTLLTRLVVSVLFLLVDMAGIFFANLAQTSAFARQYSNMQMLSLASRAVQQTN